MSFVGQFEHLRIPFRDIAEGTKNFTTIIGEGGFGPVYTGKLSLSGKLTSVAVKRLPNNSLSGQGLKEFLTEIHLLSRYKHTNLVSLLGYCEEAHEKILIYEYAKHGSFDRYLNQSKTTCQLTWRQRISICVDAARGLDYLHNHVGENHRIIHRDVKSANILLGHNWKAMIADLGLSKIGRANESVTYLITNAGGTLGYCDPAYINNGVLTKESDVYSFGVVLFEALCGRLFFTDVHGERRLHVPLARRYYEEGKLNEIMDLDLKDSKSMKEFSEIAYRCLHDDQKERPAMDFVLQKLEKVLELAEVEEAYDLQEYVEALVLQENLKALELRELQEASEMHKLGEELKLQTDYAVLKAIHMMKSTHPTYTTKEEIYTQLSYGILIDDGKVWLSVDKNGKTQEMISAISCMHLVPNKCEAVPLAESRFPMVAHILSASKTNIHLKIRTKFLSSDVTYEAYLVCKCPPFVTSMKYKLNDQDYYNISYNGNHKDRLIMMPLFQTNSLERNVEFKVLLKKFYIFTLSDEVFVEGIMFMPVQKFDDQIEKEEVESPATTEIVWENRLPSDYQRILKSPWNCFITKTKEEAYFILSKGVYITVGNIDVMSLLILFKCFTFIT